MGKMVADCGDKAGRHNFGVVVQTDRVGALRAGQQPISGRDIADPGRVADQFDRRKPDLHSFRCAIV